MAGDSIIDFILTGTVVLLTICAWCGVLIMLWHAFKGD